MTVFTTIVLIFLFVVIIGGLVIAIYTLTSNLNGHVQPLNDDNTVSNLQNIQIADDHHQPISNRTIESRLETGFECLECSNDIDGRMHFKGVCYRRIVKPDNTKIIITHITNHQPVEFLRVNYHTEPEHSKTNVLDIVKIDKKISG